MPTPRPVDFVIGMRHTVTGMLKVKKPVFRRGLHLFFLFPVVLYSLQQVVSPPLVVAQPEKGTLWVFAVGVSQYKNPALSLQYADHDAEALAQAFQTQGGKIFQKVNTKVLVNQEVSRQAIAREMQTFFASAAADDAALIALMGHGVVDGGSFYFLPHPADLTNLSSEGLPLAEFEASVREVGKKVQRLILAIDTCHAGAVEIRTRGIKLAAAGEERKTGVSLAGGLAPTSREAYILSSSKDTEESLEDASYRLPGEKRGHGAFTYAILRGLRGEADTDRDRVVNVLDLFTYASSQVPKITGGRQHPFVRGAGTNFALAETARPAKTQDVKEAAALVEEGKEHQRKGEPAKAETAFARAQELNPRDEVPEILRAQAKEEVELRQDPRAQREVINQAQQLLKAAPPPPTPDPWSPRPMVITFLDFNTLGSKQEKSGLHEVLVQRVAQALQGTKRVQVVDRRLLDHVLEELKLSMSDLSDPATRLKVGRILVARLIGTGDVVFVSDTHLAFNLRMIDTETTEIKFNLSKDGSDPEKILAMADEIALGIAEQLQREYPIRGKIISAEGDEIILNIGAKHGLTPGIKMKAIVEEPVTIDGEVVAQRKKEIGVIEITAVEEKASFARVVGRKGQLGKGAKVIEALATGAKP